MVLLGVNVLAPASSSAYPRFVKLDDLRRRDLPRWTKWGLVLVAGAIALFLSGKPDYIPMGLVFLAAGVVVLVKAWRKSAPRSG